MIAGTLRPTLVSVDLAAVRKNLEVVRRLAADCGICAVVKADAYGHGAVPISRALSLAGVEWLSVVLIEEGIELRTAGIDTPIVVMGGAYEGGYEAIVEHSLVPAVGRLEQLERLAAAVGGGASPFHLKIDTGMARLGVQPEDLPEVLDYVRRHPNLILDGVLTHFADADLGDSEFNRVQLQRFEQACAHLAKAGVSPTWAHIANSATVISFPSAHHDLVRPGLMLYGLDPTGSARGAELEPAMRWTTRPINLWTAPKGTRVSYGGVWTAQRQSTIATLPVGYADGYPRNLTGKAQVLMRGKRAPVVGTICMDMLMIDATDIEGARIGDEVVLMGEQQGDTITATEIASWAGTIPYEILVGVGARVPRRYVNES